MREKLKEKLTAIKKQEEEVRKQIEELDYNEKLKDASQYEGKYFKEVDKHNKENKYVRCLFIYSTDKERCEPMSLLIGYWKDNDKSYFNIEYYGHFHPGKWDDDDREKWIEISKEEYTQHYNEVQKRISLCID